MDPVQRVPQGILRKYAVPQPITKIPKANWKKRVLMETFGENSKIIKDLCSNEWLFEDINEWKKIKKIGSLVTR